MKDTEAIREELARITVAASSRGRGGTLSLGEAREVVSAMIASDAAPEWSAVREGREDLERVVRIIREREAQDDEDDAAAVEAINARHARRLAEIEARRSR